MASVSSLLFSIFILFNSLNRFQLFVRSNLAGTVTFCNVENRPIRCPNLYDPVCAPYTKVCSKEPCSHYQEFPNSCNACQDTKVTSYTLGTCPRSCDSFRGVSDCSNELLHPVCGAFKEDCQENNCQTNFESGCAACTNPIVKSYTLGLCPGQPTISCSVHKPSMACANDFFEPACGIFKEDCNDQSCRKDFENPCRACEDPQVISFIPSICPVDEFEEEKLIQEKTNKDLSEEEKEGNPREEFKPAFDKFGFISTHVLVTCKEEIFRTCDEGFNPVCAYFRQGCPDPVCSRTEKNACIACMNLNVEFYSLGECISEKIQ